MHREGDKTSVPKARLVRVVKNGPGRKMVGAEDVRIRVVRKMVAAPEAVERTVDGSALVAGVDTDFWLNVNRASETVAGASAPRRNAGGASGGFRVTVLGEPISDILDESGKGGPCSRPPPL